VSTEEHAPEQPLGPGPRHEDPYAHALQDGRGPLYMRRMDGGFLSSEVDRWCAAPDPADMSVLRRCEGAVLDIGCGPGRLVSALRARGHLVLGIDINHAAVARTADTGGAALCRFVFEVEAAAHDVHERLQVQFDDGRGRLGTPFPWARVGVAALRRTAAATGWQPGEHWSVGDRHFLELKRSAGSRAAHTRRQG